MDNKSFLCRRQKIPCSFRCNRLSHLRPNPPHLEALTLTPLIMPYCMSPRPNARLILSRHTMSLRVLYQIFGRENTGIGSQTPAHMECLQLAIVCLVQSSVSHLS